MRRQRSPRRSRVPSVVRRPRQGPWRAEGFEVLESRVAPASNIVYAGGLEFLASAGFEQLGTQYSASGTSSIEIGYKPLGNEKFTPLIRADMGDVLSDFTVETDPGPLSRACPWSMLAAGRDGTALEALPPVRAITRGPKRDGPRSASLPLEPKIGTNRKQNRKQGRS
jgi:hypothetical protein